MTNPASLPTMLKVRFPRATSLPRPTLPSVPRPSLPRPSWAMIGIASVDGYSHERAVQNGYARQLRTRVGTLETRFTDIVDTVGDVAKMVDVKAAGIVDTVRALDDRVDTIDDDVETANGEIRILDARVETVANDVIDTEGNVQDLDDRIDGHEYRIDDHDDKIETVEDLVNDAAVNSKAIDDVTETVTSVQAVLSALVTNVQHDRNTAAATTERLDVAAERLDALDEGRANCAIVQGRLLDSADMARSERAALANKVSATLEEQHDRVGTLAEAALIQADKIAVLETHHGDHCEALDSLDGELDAAAETVVAILREIAALRAALRASE